MQMLLVSACTLLLLLVGIILYFKLNSFLQQQKERQTAKQKGLKLLETLPRAFQDKEQPILGLAKMIGDDPQGAYSAFYKFYLNVNKAPIFQFYLLNYRMIMICGTKEVDEFVTKKLAAPGSIYKFAKSDFSVRLFKGIMDQGVLMTNGEKWKTQRKIINPSFHVQAMKLYFDDMLKVAQDLVDVWKQKITENGGNQGVELDVVPFMNMLTIEIIGRCGFDITFDALHKSKSEVLAMNYLLKYMAERGSKLFPWPGEYLQFVQSFKKTQDMFKQAIKQARLRAQQGEKAKRSSIINLIVAEEQKMNEEDLMHNLFTMFFAGFETTSITMTWCIYELARHPDIVKQLRQEIEEVISHAQEFEEEEATTTSEGKRRVSFSNLNKLKLLNAFVKEVLRMHPPVVITAVKPVADDEFMGYFIPKDSTIFTYTRPLHEDDNVWINPLHFNPLRFMYQAHSHQGESEEEVQNKYEVNPAEMKRSSFAPWGHAHRSCLGQTFATQEMLIVLSVLLQDLDFVLKDPEAKPIIVQNINTMVKELPVRISPRI